MSKMRKFVVSGLATACVVMSLGASAFAGGPQTRSAEDSKFPTKFIGYAVSQGCQTGNRLKEDDSYHYVKNDSGFNLWILSRASDGTNHTRGEYAIVPSGEWFITNYIYERKGESWCYLDITTAQMGITGILSGFWSPDSVGSYPVAN